MPALLSINSNYNLAFGDCLGRPRLFWFSDRLMRRRIEGSVCTRRTYRSQHLLNDGPIVGRGGGHKALDSGAGWRCSGPTGQPLPNRSVECVLGMRRGVGSRVTLLNRCHSSHFKGMFSPANESETYLPLEGDGGRSHEAQAKSAGGVRWVRRFQSFQFCFQGCSGECSLL